MLFTALLPALALASTALASPTPRTDSKISSVKVPQYIDWLYQNQCNVADFPSSGMTLVKTFSNTGGDKLDWSSCVALCQARGDNLAGLKGGNDCYCGDAGVFNTPLTPGSTDCNIPCPGSNKQVCGGTNSFSIIYRNGKEHYIGNV